MKKQKNIILVCLNERFCKAVAVDLASFLDMYVADCHDMLVYDLINPKDVLDKCGLEYFKSREKSVLTNCSDYENTVLSINYDLYHQYSYLFKESLVVYLNLPEGKQDKVANKIDFDRRNKFLLTMADIVIDLELKSIKKAIEKIISKLGEMYENS